MAKTRKAKSTPLVELMNDYRVVYGSPAGKRVLYDILRNCHVLEPTFDADPRVMAHNEGARNEALRLLSILQYHPQDFPQLAQEATKE